MSDQPRCGKAERLIALAEEHGWVGKAEYHYGSVSGGDEWVDVTLTTSYRHPDSGEGWEIGVMLRWYATGSRWRLGALDDAGKQVVGGVAERFRGGVEGRIETALGRPTTEFWLGSLRVLERYVEDVGSLAAWLEDESS